MQLQQIRDLMAGVQKVTMLFLHLLHATFKSYLK